MTTSQGLLTRLGALLPSGVNAALHDSADVPFGAAGNAALDAPKIIVIEAEDGPAVLSRLPGTEQILSLSGDTHTAPDTLRALLPLALELAGQTLSEDSRAAQMQALLDHTGAPIFMKDLEGRYFVSNKAHDLAHGYDKGSLTGRTDSEMFGAETAAAFRAQDVIAAEKGADHYFEDSREIDGKTHHFGIVKFPVRNAAGEVYAIGGVATDITEVKAREARLIESEAKIQAIIDNAPSAVMVKGMDGKYVLSNRAHDALWGHEAGALIGKTDEEMHGAENAADYAKSDAIVLNERRTLSFEDQRVINGTERFFMVNKFPMIGANGEVTGLGLVATDISELRAREERLIQSEKLIQSIIDNTPAHILIKDPDGTYLLTNKAHDERWGFEPGALIGRHTSEIHGDEVAAMFEAEDREMRDTLQSISYEQTHIINGEETTWLGHKFPVIDPKGALEAIGIVSTEATEMRARERKLKEINDQINASIRYAARIQGAMLPGTAALDAALPDHFLIWEPRDVVGGDLFWVHERAEGTYVIVGDCTGHGAPGAFMTLISCGVLDRHLREEVAPSPAALLTLMNRDLKIMLGQTEPGDLSATDDGLELGVSFLPKGEEALVFAGARFSLFAVDGAGVREIKGDKQALAYRRTPLECPFTDTRVPLTKDSAFYMLTDGVLDQIGGEKRIAFGRRRLADLLSRIHPLATQEAKQTVLDSLTAYQGDEARRDDMTILGFRRT